VLECVQHTARVLRAEKGGAEAAARLVECLALAGLPRSWPNALRTFLPGLDAT
jgi:hypothetical protein